MIYAVNLRTREHEVIENPDEAVHGAVVDDLYSDDQWRLVQADEDGWILWSGRECPMPGDQSCEIYAPNTGLAKADMAMFVNWRAVRAYRPVLEEPKEPEANDWRVGELVDGGNGNGVPYEIIAISGETAWLRDTARPESKGVLYPVAHMEAYRTAAQRAENEAVGEMMNVYQANTTVDARDALRDIYRAIRNGNIPGVKLEDGNA